MTDRKLPVVVVHGVGTGSDLDRAGFSSELVKRVATRQRRVTPVGQLSDGRRVARDAPVRGVRWEEALWESEHDTAESVVKALLSTSGLTGAALTRVAGFFLDLLLDVPLYLSTTGVGIRKRVRAVIAAHPGCVVVAHSLGSVIAADVLNRSYSPRGVPLDVSGFVTLGSPLNLLGLRQKMKSPFPFPWENYHYLKDPICFSDALDEERFHGVRNFQLARDEGFGVSHTHYWSSRVVSGSVRRMSRLGS